MLTPLELSSEELRAYRTRFQNARPFPHLVIDGALEGSVASGLAAEFPAFHDRSWKRFGDRYQHQKAVIDEIEMFPPKLASLVVSLNSPRFLQVLESITGIKSLIPDPYLSGGGLHCSGPGGVLAPHSDFHSYTRLGLYRRLNVLIYLNPEWSESAGGALELFNDAMAEDCAVRIAPTLGKMVIFATDNKSVHGFTDPVGPAALRKSIATYYYTSAEAPHFSGDVNTYWRRHHLSGGKRHLGDFSRLQAYALLSNISKMAAIAAFRVNPNRDRS